MKVIINTDFGGFGLSEKAYDLYKTRAKLDRLPRHKWDEDYRDDPIMVSIVEELGSDADDRFSSLAVVEIPDGYNYDIDEYDGLEHVVLKIQESRLRELIRLGNEDDVVEYVKRTQCDYCYVDEDEEDDTDDHA